jgi:large subunit ribosomal protein L25
MEQIALRAEVREGAGKEAAKKLRSSGKIPAVVYHRGEKSVSIVVDDKELSRLLRTAGGDNVLISLEIADAKKKKRSVLIKEVQHDPVKHKIIHVDFNEISLTEKITVDVEVVGQGEPVGVKQDGGLLEHGLREIKIQCLPTDIPKHIDVDVAALKVGDSIHVRDLNLGEKLKVLTDPETLLFQVRMPAEEKVEEPGAAPAEVEVIREKKEEGEAGKAPAAEMKEEPKGEK